MKQCNAGCLRDCLLHSRLCAWTVQQLSDLVTNKWPCTFLVIQLIDLRIAVTAIHPWSFRASLAGLWIESSIAYTCRRTREHQRWASNTPWQHLPNRVIGSWITAPPSTCTNVSLKECTTSIFFSGHSSPILGRMPHICIYELQLLLSVRKASTPPWLDYRSSPTSPTRVNELGNIGAAHPTTLGDSYLNHVIGSWIAVPSSTCVDIPLKEHATSTFFSGHSGTTLGRMPHIRIYVLQTGNQYFHELRIDNRFLLLLLCLTCIYDCMSCCSNILFLLRGGFLLLLLGGDIECNLAPMKKTQEQWLSQILEIVQKL